MKIGGKVLAYGMSSFKLADTLSISTEDAQSMIDKYFKKLPKVKQFLISAGEYGKTNLMMRTMSPFFRIRFFDLDSRSNFKRLGEIERESKNSRIQGK